MADGGGEGSMDLNLNLSPPSFPHVGLALGLGASTREGILEGEGEQPAGFEAEEEGLRDLLRQRVVGSCRSSSGRRRWRRIGPTVLDSSPFIILRALDRSPNPSDNEVENHRLLVADQGIGTNNASNFECNICLDMARDPVVTSCGHLFCWSCLYQWLHVHSTWNECPVCKGEVTETNITPIYGRGSSSSNNNVNTGEHGEKIPPRPHAHRIESLRQRIGRPISRRFMEAFRLTRTRVNTRGGDGGGDADANGVENILGAAADQILNRLRLVQLQRRTADLQRAASGEEEGWQMRQLLGRRSLLREGEREYNRLERLGGANSNASTELRDEWAARSEERASVSSTNAVIQTGSRSVEQDSGRSSSPHRRRNGASASLDVDGGLLHCRKRRRLN